MKTSTTSLSLSPCTYTPSHLLYGRVCEHFVNSADNCLKVAGVQVAREFGQSREHGGKNVPQGLGPFTLPQAVHRVASHPIPRPKVVTDRMAKIVVITHLHHVTVM